MNQNWLFKDLVEKMSSLFQNIHPSFSIPCIPNRSKKPAGRIANAQKRETLLNITNIPV